MDSRRSRFELYEFDAAKGELRREGVLVRLQGQPALALGCLLANAGQVVTREELCRAIWGSDTHVDFERGLNFCIGQIRAALEDDADTPRFIRTIPRRGYQFIDEV
jgi:DNA-binding winged helix-turn-helix (wHTH) protein